jgi:hypothetical protein
LIKFNPILLIFIIKQQAVLIIREDMSAHMAQRRLDHSQCPAQGLDFFKKRSPAGRTFIYNLAQCDQKLDVRLDQIRKIIIRADIWIANIFWPFFVKKLQYRRCGQCLPIQSRQCRSCNGSRRRLEPGLLSSSHTAWQIDDAILKPFGISYRPCLAIGIHAQVRHQFPCRAGHYAGRVGGF